MLLQQSRAPNGVDGIGNAAESEMPLGNGGIAGIGGGSQMAGGVMLILGMSTLYG